jgi:uncharacterized membrane protein
MCLEAKSSTAKAAVAISVILALLLPLIIILSNTKSTATDEKFIHSEFEKVGTYENFNKKTADDQTTYLIGYLRFGKGTIDTDFYNEREKDHLVEVKDIFQKTNKTLSASTVLFLIGLLSLSIMIKRIKRAKTDKRELTFTIKGHTFDLKDFTTTLCAILISGTLITNLVMIIMTISLLNFDTTFTIFHQISFERDTWLLSPEDNLIKLYPEQFWLDSATKVAVMTLLYTNALLILAILLYRTNAKTHG